MTQYHLEIRCTMDAESQGDAMERAREALHKAGAVAVGGGVGKARTLSIPPAKSITKPKAKTKGPAK